MINVFFLYRTSVPTNTPPSFLLHLSLSRLFLHLSNDGGIIFLPLIACLLSLSPSNDRSLISLPLSFSLSHYSSHSLARPPPGVSLFHLIFFFFWFMLLFQLPVHLPSYFLLIDRVGLELC